MSDVELVTGDTAPTLRSRLRKKNEDGSTSVRLLTDVASVCFQMRKPDDARFTVNAVASVEDAAAGLVAYVWKPGDLTVPGEFQCQWELTMLDGKVQTTTPANTITVRRQ